MTLTLDEVTSLDRIVYGARQDGAKGKGFAEKFEIYASLTDDQDDFTLVSQGGYSGSTGDIVEIKFEETKFKRIKFKFKKAIKIGHQLQNLCFIKKIHYLKL